MDISSFRKDLYLKELIGFGSALVGYIYTKCGILKSDTDLSILRPSDFSIMSEHLKFKDIAI